MVKLSGAGNSFLFVKLMDADDRADWKALFGDQSRAKVAQKLCDPRLSIGADGLVIIEPSSTFDFQWDFYNSDGSVAEMCGNAARCAVVFARHALGTAAKKFTWQAVNTIVTGELLTETEVRVRWDMKIGPKKTELLKLGEQNISVDVVNTGVPHAVLIAPNADTNFASQIRHHPHFQPEGTNVTFVTIKSPKEIEAKTFERGVEDFTLACGTGALAAAFSVSSEADASTPILVRMPGGLLTVESLEPPQLRGPVELIANITLFR